MNNWYTYGYVTHLYIIENLSQKLNVNLIGQPTGYIREERLAFEGVHAYAREYEKFKER